MAALHTIFRHILLDPGLVEPLPAPGGAGTGGGGEEERLKEPSARRCVVFELLELALWPPCWVSAWFGVQPGESVV